MRGTSAENGRIAVAAAREGMLEAARVEIQPRRIDLDGGPTLQVLEAGRGAPVLLLHGSGVDASSMVPLIEHLDDLHVFAVDRPGYGLSDPVDYRHGDYHRTAVETVEGVLDALELQTADFIGNSTGSVWGLWAALDRPERVGRLVMVGATPLLPGTKPVLPLRLMTTPMVGPLMGKVMPDPSPSMIKKMMAGMGEGDTIERHPRLVDAMVAAGSDPIASGAAQDELGRMIRGLAGFRREQMFGRDELRRITHQVLLIWGDHDPIGDVEAARHAQGVLPHARLHILPTGHAPWLGEPEATADLITEYFHSETSS